MADASGVGKGTLWTGRGLSGLVSAFMLVDGGLRLIGFAPYVEGLSKVGYSPSLAPAIAISLLVPTILYLIPRTAVFGAILMTGYLGGATATQVRMGDPWFLFPVVMGVMAWAGIWLRDTDLRGLIPVRKS